MDIRNVTMALEKAASHIAVAGCMSYLHHLSLPHGIYPTIEFSPNLILIHLIVDLKFISPNTVTPKSVCQKSIKKYERIEYENIYYRHTKFWIKQKKSTLK